MLGEILFCDYLFSMGKMQDVPAGMSGKLYWRQQMRRRSEELRAREGKEVIPDRGLRVCCHPQSSQESIYVAPLGEKQEQHNRHQGHFLETIL